MDNLDALLAEIERRRRNRLVERALLLVCTLFALVMMIGLMLPTLGSV